MSVISDLEGLVLDRLEENRASPIFWDVRREIRVFLVEAMNEAALISGEPEIRFANSPSTPLILPANQTVIDFTGSIPIFGMMRLESSGQVKKTTVWDLDRFLPGWESDVGNLPDYWFPIGLTQFGIHPQLNDPVSVIVSGISQPVPTPRPYAGTENVDYQEEFRDAFVDYAEHIAGLKEGTKEFVDSIKVYDRFIAKMQELSKFASRKEVLRFSRTFGARGSTSPVQVR